MQIDLLHFDGCPSWQDGLGNLKAALAAGGMDVEIRLVQVEDNDEAARRCFLGSPSFHVNGADLWPEERATYALSCRVYSTSQGMRGVPDVEMLRQKLQVYTEIKTQ